MSLIVEGRESLMEEEQVKYGSVRKDRKGRGRIVREEYGANIVV